MSKNDAHCVLLADRHHRLMEGVRGLLETEFDVVVMVSDEVSLCESATRMKLDTVVVDFSLACGDGLGLVRKASRPISGDELDRSRHLQRTERKPRDIRSRSGWFRSQELDCNRLASRD